MGPSATRSHPADTALSGEQRITMLPGEQRMLATGTRYRIGAPPLFASWGRNLARVGEQVPLLVEMKGPDGTAVRVDVHHEARPDEVLASFDLVLGDGAARTTWSWRPERDAEWTEAKARAYRWPDFVFVATARGVSGRSQTLRLEDTFDATLVDAGGMAVLDPGIGFELLLADGGKRTGRLDAGKVHVEGVPPGPCRLTLQPPERRRSTKPRARPPAPSIAARWSASEARCGEDLGLQVSAPSLPDGTRVHLWVYSRHAPRQALCALDATLSGGEATARWSWRHEPREEWSEALCRHYRWPEFEFLARAGGVEARSSTLRLTDVVEATVLDAEGAPAPAGATYALRLADGSWRSGALVDGRVREERVPPGPCRLAVELPGAVEEVPRLSARWGASAARCGEDVALEVAAEGLPDGTPVRLEVFEKDTTTPDDFVKALQATVEGGRARASWTYRYLHEGDEARSTESEAGTHSPPEFYFKARARGLEAASSVLRFTDTFEATIVDDRGDPLPAGAFRYQAELADGTSRTGILDGANLVLADLPPGPVRLTLRRS